MQKHTQHIYSFQSEHATVVVDSAASLRLAASSPITIPLDRLEEVHALLTQVLADVDVAALLPVEEPEPVDEPDPEFEP